MLDRYEKKETDNEKICLFGQSYCLESSIFFFRLLGNGYDFIIFANRKVNLVDIGTSKLHIMVNLYCKGFS